MKGEATTAVGYQPVGMYPDTAPTARLTTATAFMSPSETYSVPSSGESARPVGVAPARPRVPAGRSRIVAAGLLSAVLKTETVSE